MLQAIVAGLFALALGALFCFVGYRVFLVMLPIWGFFAGFWLGAQGIALLFGDGFLLTITGWVVGFVLGLVFALLSYLFYTIGVAFVAAGFGAAIGIGIMGLFGFDGFLAFVIALALAIGLIVATFIFNLQKYVIIAITAIGGANAIILGPMLLFGTVTVDQLKATGGSIGPMINAGWFWGLLWLVVAIAGIVVQIRGNREYSFSREQFVEGWG